MKAVKGGRGGERKKTLRGCSKEEGEEKAGIEKKRTKKTWEGNSFVKVNDDLKKLRAGKSHRYASNITANSTGL